MNSVSSEGDLHSIEMAGISDGQSGAARINERSFDSDSFSNGVEQQYVPPRAEGKVVQMTPI